MSRGRDNQCRRRVSAWRVIDARLAVVQLDAMPPLKLPKVATMLPLPPPEAEQVDLGDVLQVLAPGKTRMLDFRVDAGLVFVRSWIATSDPNAKSGFQQMPMAWVMQLFSENPSIAAWLRHRGVDILRMALLRLGDAEDAA